MGEIRSTMDIIMEKTRGLKATEEEKSAFQRQETEAKVRGLVQKLLDGLLNLEQAEKEMASFTGKMHGVARACLREECIRKVDLEGDNAILLEILQTLVGIETGPINRVISAFRSELAKERKKREEAKRERLGQRGISGPAVFPNMEADGHWKAFLSEVRNRLQEEIRHITVPV